MKSIFQMLTSLFRKIRYEFFGIATNALWGGFALAALLWPMWLS